MNYLAQDLFPGLALIGGASEPLGCGTRLQVNQPIDHHYLPVFYLKQWRGDGGKIVRYYRPYKDVVASAIAPENTAFEPNLYALSGCPRELRAFIETHYMAPEVDTPASDALTRLLASDLSNMSHREERAWARFLMSLALRNPATLSSMNAGMRQQMIAQLSVEPEVREAYRASGDRRSIEAWIEDCFPAMLERAGTLHLPLFIEKLSEPFHTMSWFRLDLGNAVNSLLTSDRPLVDQYGFRDPRYVVALPLSPRFLFVAANTRETIRALVSHDADIVVASINEKLVIQAAAHVYGNTKAHLTFVEKHLRPRHQEDDIASNS